MMLDEDKTERAMSGGASHVPKGLKAREGEQNELGGLRTIMMIGECRNLILCLEW